MINKEQTTIIIISRVPKKTLLDAGYIPHPKGKGFLKYIAHKRRFHAYIVSNRIEIHLDATVEGKHKAVLNEYFFEEMSRVQEVANQNSYDYDAQEAKKKEKSEDACHKYQVDLMGAVKEFVKLQLKPLPGWFPVKIQKWLVAKLVKIHYDK